MKVYEEITSFYSKNENSFFIPISIIKDLNLYKGVFNRKTNYSFVEAEAFMRIYFGYRIDKIDMYASIKLYDSKCRNCDEWERKWQRSTLKEV